MKRDATSDMPSAVDKRVLSLTRINWQTVALVLIVAVLVFTRLWDMGNRSFSHDEAIHAWEAWKLITGQRYTHDPVYHGPFLYHVTAFFYFLFGISDVTARLGVSLASVALVLLVWPLRRWLGRAGALFAMFLLAISPTMMHRGRFLRHDVFVMVPAMVLVICFFHYLEDRKERWLYIGAGALSVAFCVKANAYIVGAIFGSFWALHLLVEWVQTRKPLRDLAAFDIVVLLGTLALPWASAFFIKITGGNPLDYSQPGLVRSGVIVLIMFTVSAVIGIWWKRKVWLISAGIFWGIFIVLYTTLLTNARGAATGLVGMLGYWLGQQEVARGGQPWYYYFFLLTVYEFLPWLLSGLGTVYYVWTARGLRRASTRKDETAPELPRGTHVLPSFLLYWIVLNLVIFTWSGEKMPWQTQHIVLPIAIFAGWFVGRVWETTDWRELLRRGAGYMMVLLPVALLSFAMLLASLQAKPFSGASLEQLEATLRFVLSLILLWIAVALMYVFGRRLGWRGWSRVVLVALFVVLGAVTARSAIRLAFVNQDYATEFLTYAAATPDTTLIMQELDDMSRRLAGDLELVVAYDDESSWPFVWLLRDYKDARFFTSGMGAPSDAAVVLVGPGNEEKVKQQLRAKYFRRQYRLIWWPNQDVYGSLTPANLWSDLKDPVRRKFWWDILWDRDYEQSTTSWPYVQKLAMYVRKDIAAQLWDYGPEVAGPGIELPEDEYVEKHVQLSPLSTWGSYGDGSGQFDYPKGLAVDASQGNVYVVDSYNHRVQEFDAQGVFVRQWGSAGNAPGQFQEPWAVTVDSEGMVYVADTWNHRIQKFDANGRFLKQWGVFADTVGELGDPNGLYGPRDVAVDNEGNVWVSDTGNKRILQFTSEGEFLRQIGGAGSLQGQFRESVGLAIDGDGNVYVADTWNQRIQKLDRNGSFVTEWPVLGWEGEGVTNKPYLAVDDQGNVYATAPDYHRVVKFDGSGKLLAVWGDYGADVGSLNMPSAIAVDSTGNVYVLDSANHRVVKYGPVR